MRTAIYFAIAYVAIVGLLAFSLLSQVGVTNVYFPSQKAKVITIDQALELVKKFLASLNNPDLAVTEIMEFTNHFYIEIFEKSTGIHAFELLMDKYDGAIYPEPGPNMMWNTKYGDIMRRIGGMGWMGGMMISFQGTPTAEMPVTAKQAVKYAQEFLRANIPGSVAGEIATFYGYYTLHVLKNDKIYGMLSVNGYSGQVWYHVWHGAFVDIKEIL